MANQNGRSDWEDLGDSIERIIDRAVSSHDYQQLNQTIRQTVSRAANSGSEAIRQVVDAVSSGPHSNKNRYSSTLRYSSRPRVVEEKPALPALYGNTTGKKIGGVAKMVGGAMLAAGSGIWLLLSGLGSLIFQTNFVTFGTVLAFMALAGGGYLLGSGGKTLRYLRDFEKIKQILGQKTYCEFQKLAGVIGSNIRFVRKELHWMLDQGLFLEGHLDDGETSLITSHETYRHYRETQQQMEAREQLRMQEARQAEQAKAEHSQLDPQVQEVLDKGNGFIHQIRYCNDAIPGEEISEKISHMEMIVQKIFDRAKAHPQIIPELKKLMDYYLPMTVKLLNAYAEMDAQPIQGETIQNSKKEIEQTLDTLNDAFEKLLDSVFKETAMDVSSDITVLQTLLAQEGLADDELMRMKKETNG